jgi:two-component system NarL family sensor kinase
MAEQSLRESQDRFRVIADSSPAPIFLNDAHANCIFFNRAYEIYFGVKLQDATHDSWKHLIHPDDVEVYLAEYNAANKEQRKFKTQIRIRSAAGDIRYVEAFCEPRFDQAGRYLGMTGICIDVTDRVKAEEALHQSRESFKTVVNLVPDLIWRSELNGDTHWYNQRWLDYTGQTLEEASAYGWLDAIHPDDKEQSLKAFQWAIKTKRPFKQEHRIRNINGQYQWFLVQAEPFYDENGEITKWFGTATNIHDRKQAEEQLQNLNAILEQQVADRTQDLQKSEELLKTTLDSSPNLIQVFKAVRNDANEIIDFVWALNNAAAEQVHGNVIGKSLLKHNPGVIPTGIFESFKRVTETGTPQQYEKHYVYEGYNGWFYQSVVKLNDGVATSTSDITERKQAEEDLKNSKERLQSVFDTSLIGMSILEAVRDKDGLILDFRIALVNKELARETARNDLVGKLYAQEYPGIKTVGLYEIMLRVMQTGKPEGTEYYYPHDGFNKWFSCKFVKLNDGLVATNLDITERKKAEDERYKNLTLLQQSEQSAVMGSWEYDILTGPFNWSDGMYHLFELPIGTKVRPETYLQYVTPASQPVVLNMIESLKSGQTAFEETLEFSINGNIKIFKVKATAIRNTNGRPVKLLGLNMDITAAIQAEEKIRHMELEQQREVFKATLSTQEEERRRIAESLHNGLGQMLYGVKLSLDYIDPKNITAIEAEQSFLSVKKLLGDCIKEARRISHELTPTVLEDYGLKEAIKDICRQLSGIVNFECIFTGLNSKMDKYLEIAVYRILQELMLNIIKHAQATQASTQVDVTKKNIIITVEDNGQGFDTSVIKNNGIGLSGIRNKVNLLNGKVNITSQPGKGTTVIVKIPRK